MVVHFMASLTDCTHHPSLVHRELLSLSDGGQLYLDWCGDSYDEQTQTDSDPERPTVIILPGITGECTVCAWGEGEWGGKAQQWLSVEDRRSCVCIMWYRCSVMCIRVEWRGWRCVMY